MEDTLRTDRLLLRPMLAQDAGWIAAEIANPKVLRWLTTPPSPYRKEDAAAFIERFGGQLAHCAILRGEEPLGVISLSEARGLGPELGYWLKEAAWGQGYMMEAARGIMADHWKRSTAPVLSGWIQGNSGSAQILTQLGFAPEALIQRWTNFHGCEMPLERVRLDQPSRELFTCKTPRLRINALTMNDLPVMHAEWGAPEVARMLSSVKPNWTLGEARDWLRKRCTPTSNGFGRAVRLHDGTLIGSIGMGSTPRTLGYHFGTAFWNNGYATEALRAFAPAAFAHFDDLDEVYATVFDDNPASAHVLGKLGFEYVGAGDPHSIARVEQSPASKYRLSRATLKV